MNNDGENSQAPVNLPKPVKETFPKGEELFGKAEEEFAKILSCTIVTM